MSTFSMIDWDKKKIGEIICEDISDGYHTFEDLYNHRFALFCALVKCYDSLLTPIGPTAVRAWKSRHHEDGTMFPGFFIAGLTKKNLDETETHISYHLPVEWWDRFKCIEIMVAPHWDGYNSNDVVKRLIEL
jgi:hypothetical protein